MTTTASWLAFRRGLHGWGSGRRGLRQSRADGNRPRSHCGRASPANCPGSTIVAEPAGGKRAAGQQRRQSQQHDADQPGLCDDDRRFRIDQRAGQNQHAQRENRRGMAKPGKIDQCQPDSTAIRPTRQRPTPIAAPTTTSAVHQIDRAEEVSIALRNRRRRPGHAEQLFKFGLIEARHAVPQQSASGPRCIRW